MGTFRIAVVGLLVVAAMGCSAETKYEPTSGDIIFQTSRSSQSVAIQMATNSKYSHMGIVYLRGGVPFVFEAVEPVKITPLDEWIARGENGHFVVKRLSNASTILTPDALRRMQVVAEEYMGRHYDLYFEWSEERIYCSELVWLVYQRALDISIGDLETLGDFDLSSPVVKKLLAERWGENPPMDELVISPAAVFASDKLVEVYHN